MKHLLLLTAAAVCTLSASADLLNIGNTIEPGAGICDQVGSTRVYFSSRPYHNPACTESATLSRNGEVLNTIEPGSSAIQISGIMQSDLAACFRFTNKPYTLPGKYDIHVPEGMLMFNDGKDFNAEFTVTYIIPEPLAMEFSQEPGYVSFLDKTLEITFTKATKVIDNHTPMGMDDVGCIRFDTPLGYCLPERTIEGNKMTINLGTKQAEADPSDYPEDYERSSDRRIIHKEIGSDTDIFTEPGRYHLSFGNDNVTVVYPDGTTENNREMHIEWLLPNITYPSVDPLPGEVNQIGDINVKLAAGDIYGVFMGTPALYALDSEGNKRERVATFKKDIPQGKTVRSLATDNIAFIISNEISIPGEYLLEIPKSCFSIQGEDGTLGTDTMNCIEYKYYYTVKDNGTSEVNRVEAAPAELSDVYSLNGVLIGRNLSRAMIDNLPSGFYIINGKKIVKGYVR